MIPLCHLNDGQIHFEASAYVVYLGMSQPCLTIIDLTLRAETLGP